MGRSASRRARSFSGRLRATTVVMTAALMAVAAACVPDTPPEPGPATATGPTVEVAYGDPIPDLEPTYSAGTVPSVPATCVTEALAGSAVGEYPVTCSGGELNGQPLNHVSGTLTIVDRLVTVTASSGSFTYGGDAPAISATYDGLFGLTEPATLATCATDATSTAAVGDHSSSCEGAEADNHRFEYVDGTVEVTPAPVVVTASSASKVYGADAPVVTAAYAGLVNGDTAPAVAAECSTTAATDSSTGTYPSSCADADDANYTFSYVGGEVLVTPAPLSIIASSAAAAFGDEIPAVTAEYSGLVAGDEAPATPPVCSTTATAGASAGTYPTTCSGAEDQNYEISYVDGELQISAGTAPVVVTASSATVTYGDDIPAITASYGEFSGGQTEPDTAPVCSTAATIGSDVGTYPTTCVDAADPNHVFSYVAGSITITPATATVTAGSSTSVYGNAVAAVEAAFSGLVAGDTAPAAAPVCSTDATSSSPVGSYVTTCADAADPNYVFDHVDGTHSVTPAAAVVTASSATITEGDAVPAIDPSYSGFVNGDVAPGTAPTCSTTATDESGAGTYATTCAGAADSNYSFSYVDGELTIEAAVVVEPFEVADGLATYAPTSAATTATTGGANLPTGTGSMSIPAANTGPFSTWTNLVVETTTGLHPVFCDGKSSTQFTGCRVATGVTGAGALIEGGFIGNAPIASFDVYDLAGGPSAVEPSSLTIVEDVPSAVRGVASFVRSTASHGTVNYVQSAGATGDFSLTYGICRAGTAAYDAEDANCATGTVDYQAPSIARIGSRFSVSIVTQTVYNDSPIAVSAPAAASQGETFTMKWASAPGSMPLRQSSGLTVTVNNGSTFASYIPVPAGLTYVEGSARLVGGDARMSTHASVQYCTAAGGNCDATLSGNYDFTTQPYIKVWAPNNANGQVTGGNSFTMPSLEADFVATGDAGTESSFALTQYRVITATSLATADFRGYATESTTTSSAPVKAVPRPLATVAIG